MKVLMSKKLLSCHCCGLIQASPQCEQHQTLICRRCGTSLNHCNHTDNDLAGMMSMAALIIYLPAILLPLLQIERLGQASQNSLAYGVISLLADGYLFVGSIIFLFSILLPPIKLIAMLVLIYHLHMGQYYRAKVYLLVEKVGKWGMLDVMLVAILVAFVKLGDLVTITAGPGLWAFSVMVLLSLLASFLYNPHCLWHEAFDE